MLFRSLKLAKKLGAKHLINYNTTPDWDKEVMKITHGRGVDHIIEVGGSGTLPKSVNSVRIGGHIHLIGFIAKGGDDSMNFVLQTISKSINLRGVYIGPVNKFLDMNRLIEAHPQETRPVIDKVFPFDDAVKAWEHLESQKHVGKVVIQVAKD